MSDFLGSFQTPHPSLKLDIINGRSLTRHSSFVYQLRISYIHNSLQMDPTQVYKNNVSSYNVESHDDGHGHQEK